MMIDEKMDPSVAKGIVRGEQDKLNSAFYLGYNMILNLMRVETISPEFMLEGCFYQFQNTASVSGLETGKNFHPRSTKPADRILELHELETQRSGIEISDETTVREYYDLRKQLAVYTQDMHDVIRHPNYSLPFMQPGRLVKIKYGDSDFGWGAVVTFSQRRISKDSEEKISPQQSYVIDVLLQVSAEGASNGTKTYQDLPQGVRPPMPGENIKMEVVPVLLSCVEAIGHIRIFLPKDLKTAEQRSPVKKMLDEVERRFPDGIAVLDPIENMGITDESFKKLLRVLKARGLF